MCSTVRLSLIPISVLPGESNNILGVSMYTGSFPRSKRPTSNGYPVQALAAALEILFAAFCSIITYSYTIHHESTKEDSSPESFQHQFLAISEEYEGNLSFMLNPPPTFMLISCLVLGCAVSSFAYRRQDRDKLQPPIFIAAITLACLIGLATNLSANVIMLGMIPWSLCAAMVLCTIVNSVAGSLKKRRIVYGQLQFRCCEMGEIKEKDSATIAAP